MARPWNIRSVRIGLGAAVLAAASFFLPWGNSMGSTKSLIQLYYLNPDLFAGLLPTSWISVAWIIGCFLLDHPKLTLVGTGMMLLNLLGVFILLTMVGIALDLGFILNLICAVTLVIMAIATPKLSKESA